MRKSKKLLVFLSAVIMLMVVMCFSVSAAKFSLNKTYKIYPLIETPTSMPDESKCLKDYTFKIKKKTTIRINVKSYGDKTTIESQDFQWQLYNEDETISEFGETSKKITLKPDEYTFSIVYPYYCCENDYCEKNCSDEECIKNRKVYYEISVSTVNPEKIKLSNKKINLKLNKTKTLKYTITPENSYISKVKWSSSNSKVATVNSKGKVTAKGLGKCTITLTVNGKIKAKCTVTVNEMDMYVFKGDTFNLPKINGKKTTNWKSKNKKIATSKTKLKGKKQGKTTITKKVSKVTYVCNVYVTDYKKLTKEAKKINPNGELVYTGYYSEYDDNYNPKPLSRPAICLQYRYPTIFGYDYEDELFVYTKDFKLESVCYYDTDDRCEKHQIDRYKIIE